MCENNILDDIYKSCCTGVYSIEQLMPHIKEPEFYGLLKAHAEKFERIGSKAEKMIIDSGRTPDVPTMMTKFGIWSNVNINMISDDTVSHTAKMLVEGNTMGITTLTSELNDVCCLAEEVMDVAEELMNTFKDNIEALKPYL